MKKIDGKTAKRYAKALFECTDQSKLDEVLAALKELAGFWESSNELREAMTNPMYKQDDRLAAIKDIAKSIRDDEQFVNFSLLLCENKRLAGVGQITSELALLIAEMRKVLALEISSAKEVAGDERSSLEEKIKSEFGPLATVTWQVDPALIGGMVVRAGDKLLDGSVQGNLEKIRSQLLS